MATIVNTPGNSADSSGSNGLLVGIVLLIIIGILFWIFGMPYLRGGSGGGAPARVENNVQVPGTSQSAPAPAGDTNINVPIPDNIDVNVQDGQNGQ